MTERYEHLMSTRPRGERRLIFHEGGFSALPDHIRQQGPWTGTFTGEVERLRPEYRLGLAHDGYVLIEGQALRWKAEVDGAK